VLYKINKLENIKQWQHKGGVSVSFERLNLIYGRNGSGKSTLGNIFELINTGDIESINALAPLESNDSPNLNFLFKIGSKTDSIDLTSLDKLAVQFHIFNQSFIDRNLYSTKGVESSQLVNYYDFCLGSVAVAHQQKIDELKAKNDELTNQISPISSGIRAKFGNQTIAQIKKIKTVDDADRELEKLNNSLVDINNTEHFKKRKKLSELTLQRPTLDTGCFSVSVEQLSKDAQEKVEKHIETNLKERDTSWLEGGLNLVADEMKCPFCAQPLSGSPIFHLYQEFINESYLKASDNFELASGEFELSVSSIGVDLENLEEVAKANHEIIREWSDRLKDMELDFDFKELNELDKKIYFESRKLIKSKEKDLLSTVDLTQFNSIVEQFFKLVDFSGYNSKVKQFNESIDDFFLGLGTGTSQSIQTKIDSIKESQERYKTETVSDLEVYEELDSDKKTNTTKIDKLRGLIAEEQEQSIGRHKDSINELLKSFNSMIRVDELKKDNKGHKGATRIIYVITFINNSLSVLNDDQKIFEQVLSAGDKSALALAFFLSKYREKNSEGSIVVLDDPMSSLDIHRKDATVIEIEKLINNGYQTFVLSHDPFFLSEVLKHSTLSKDTKCYEIKVSYKDIDPFDAHSAQYISSQLVHRNNFESYVLHSYHKEYLKLKEYVESATEEKKAEVARSIRPILEAYMRFLFPTHFTQDTWLGGMITKIRDEENEASVFYDKTNKLGLIEKINEFSKSFHHAEGFDTKIQSLDMQTVKNYAKDTLFFITGL